ncbi:MAG: M48 family peptidase [Alphaproteobacteria bacterium HGW-Alphaproteobacteria-2]|nr:MAG: M48 family peptidase [Alphaproteobacteria bacterium HGW-Alphaproteobacteria-2]
MSEFVLPGEPPVAVRLRRSTQARRLSLRVSRLDGRVTLTLPRGVAEREGRAFAIAKAAWLRAALAGQPARLAVAPGTLLPVEGVSHEVDAAAGRGGVRCVAGQLIVAGPPERLAVRLRAHLVALARLRLQAAANRHAVELGRGYCALTLADPRSRWGSCSAAGRLMFSWRLVMAPPEVLDYVAAHEVAHLAEMNHSPAFWAVVARLCPGHAAPRAWLRAEGPGLHRYDFAAPASASASSAE